MRGNFFRLYPIPFIFISPLFPSIQNSVSLFVLLAFLLFTFLMSFPFSILINPHVFSPRLYGLFFRALWPSFFHLGWSSGV